jgi:hypothetical protein
MVSISCLQYKWECLCDEVLPPGPKGIALTVQKSAQSQEAQSQEGVDEGINKGCCGRLSGYQGC